MLTVYLNVHSNLLKAADGAVLQNVIPSRLLPGTSDLGSNHSTTLRLTNTPMNNMLVNNNL